MKHVNRIVVVEANEIPIRVFRWYADQRPDSTISLILDSGRTTTTINGDDYSERELYPSQTWATMATGVPYETHGVYWYADAKPVDYPLYWKIAAKDRSVGVVGAIHSSPLDYADDLPGLAFCLPDVFAPDARAIPGRLEPLQSFMIEMAKENSRAVSSAGLKRYAEGVAAVRGAKVGLRTLASIGSTAASIAVRRAPAERLRTAQFELTADVFLGLLDEHDPDLAVLFTNHVAAAMHRYWAATFPDDWAESSYTSEWIAKYSDEILHAVDALDRMLSGVLERCLATERVLVIVSSMGQTAATSTLAPRTHAFIVRDPATFYATVGLTGSYTPRLGMAPQISAEFQSEHEARTSVERLNLDDEWLTIDRTGAVVTATYRPEIVTREKLLCGDVHRTPGELGGEVLAVDDGRSGDHDPRGVLFAVNGDNSVPFPETVDALEFAPAVLQALGIEPLPHHVNPSFGL